ncbi:MAG: N-acetylneuraminate synthase family protein [Planctomycetota bacterium]
MRIGQRDIRLDLPPYIIAEIGVNHDGDADRARALVNAAATAGAHAVKLQYFRADRLMSRACRPAQYQSQAGFDDPIDMLRALELDHDDLSTVIACAHDAGIDAIVTAFSVDDVDEIDDLPWAAYKVASPDCVHEPLIRRLQRTGRPMIVSTGAATADEVAQTVRWLNGHTFALLHCVSAYPTPDEQASLGGIVALSRLTDGPIGYSDHTMSEDTGALAVAAGACVLERHLTYDRAARGPDHAASLDPDGLQRYIAAAMRAARMRGLWTKRVQDIEEDVRRVSRQSIVATRHLSAGHVLTDDDVTFKRPGEGVAAAVMVTGRRLIADIEADMPLTEAHLS